MKESGAELTANTKGGDRKEIFSFCSFTKVKINVLVISECQMHSFTQYQSYYDFGYAATLNKPTSASLEFSFQVTMTGFASASHLMAPHARPRSLEAAVPDSHWLTPFSVCQSFRVDR